MDTQHDRFEPVPRAQADATRPEPRSEPAEASNGNWPSAVTPMPPRPRKRGLSRVAGITLAALLIFSGLFTAFAAGMVTQRAVNGGPATAAAAPSGAPNSIDGAWNLVHSQYVDPSAINDDKMTEAAIDGMLATLHDEGHTRYQTARRDPIRERATLRRVRRRRDSGRHQRRPHRRGRANRRLAGS